MYRKELKIHVSHSHTASERGKDLPLQLCLSQTSQEETIDTSGFQLGHTILNKMQTNNGKLYDHQRGLLALVSRREVNGEGKGFLDQERQT